MDNDLLTPERITITTMLVGALVSGARKVWVFGYQLVESQAREKLANERAARWEGIALRALNVSEKALGGKNEESA